MALQLQEIKEKARKTWAEGNYRTFASYWTAAPANLLRAAGVKPGDKVLDVGCGTGVFAITAARAGATVTGLDLTPELLAMAKDEAATAGVEGIVWQEGDAEAMPFVDGSFDVVVSNFGHMFTPDPAAAARELVRVAKPGGRIAFNTWPPESAAGHMFRTIGGFLPPPPGAAPPPQWGVPDIVRERLGDGVEGLHFERGTAAVPALSPGHLWHLFRTSYGPMVVALAKLAGDRAKQEALARDVQAVFASYFQENAVRFDYLLTRATKKSG